MSVQIATIDELDARTLYALLRLRTDVFVVEQHCPYPELDGRDLEPATRHLWLTDAHSQPQAYLRVLAEPDGAARIGRVCTAAAARRRGLSDHLVRVALDLIGEQTPVVLDAQSYLVGFYAHLGFAASGAPFVEDDIPHTPMRRDAGASRR